MSQNRGVKKRLYLLELVWWVFAVCLSIVVVLPLYLHDPSMPFLVSNTIFVVTAIIFTRYIFFLNLSLWKDKLIVQSAIALAMVPFVFYLVSKLNAFIAFFDEKGYSSIPDPDSISKGDALYSYFTTEYQIFATWAIIAASLMPFRLIYNAWKRYRLQRK